MLVPTLIMGALALVLLVLAWQQGRHWEGLRASGELTVSVLPLLVMAFLVAGLVQVLMPETIIRNWLSDEAGLRGIGIASIAGALCPGGPFVSLPIVAGLFRGGAGVGPLVAFLTAWSLWSINRLPMEIGILGWRLTAIRLVCTLLFPPLAGMIAMVLFRDFGR